MKDEKEIIVDLLKHGLIKNNMKITEIGLSEPVRHDNSVHCVLDLWGIVYYINFWKIRKYFHASIITEVLAVYNIKTEFSNAAEINKKSIIDFINKSTDICICPLFV